METNLISECRLRLLLIVNAQLGVTIKEGGWRRTDACYRSRGWPVRGPEIPLRHITNLPKSLPAETVRQTSRVWEQQDGLMRPKWLQCSRGLVASTLEGEMDEASFGSQP